MASKDSKDVRCAYADGLDDALLGFNKMPFTWMREEKQHRDQKVLSQIYLYLSNQNFHDVLKEKSVIDLWLKLELLYMRKSLISN